MHMYLSTIRLILTIYFRHFVSMQFPPLGTVHSCIIVTLTNSIFPV